MASSSFGAPYSDTPTSSGGSSGMVNAEEKEDEDAPSLSAGASEFVPNFPVASGFESVEILKREEEG